MKILSKINLVLSITILGTVIATCASVFAAQDLMDRTLHLKAKTLISSQQVCLSDLVEDGWVQGRCAVDRAMCCRWNLNGELSRSIPNAEITKELKNINFFGVRLSISGPAVTEVTQTHRELSLRELQQNLVKNIAERTGENAGNINVAAIKVQNPIYVALSSESDWDVAVPETVSEQMLLRVVLKSDPSKILGWIQPTVRIDTLVYVAKRLLKANDELKEEDFSIAKVNLQSLQAQAYHNGQFPNGVRLKQPISRGMPLTAAVIERTPIVHIGETVTLILRSDSLRISTKGVVQSNAAVGDTVSVQLQRYNRTFRGRLVEGKLVEVWL